MGRKGRTGRKSSGLWAGAGLDHLHIFPIWKLQGLPSPLQQKPSPLVTGRLGFQGLLAFPTASVWVLDLMHSPPAGHVFLTPGHKV